MIGLILAGISAALSVGGAVAGASEKNKAASATRTAAKDSFLDTSHALALRSEQESLAAAQQVHQISQSSTYERGSLAAIAGASGVEGNTVDALDADLVKREYDARDIVDRNLVMTQQQIARNRSAAKNEMQSRINGAPGASNLATGIQIGGALTAFGYDWMRLHPNPNPKVSS